MPVLSSTAVNECDVVEKTRKISSPVQHNRTLLEETVGCFSGNRIPQVMLVESEILLAPQGAVTSSPLFSAHIHSDGWMNL